ESQVLVVLNFTPVPRMNYRLGVSGSGYWKEILNSDAVEYGGSGQGNLGGVSTDAHAFHGKEHSIRISLPPLGALLLKNEVGPYLDHIQFQFPTELMPLGWTVDVRDH